MDTLQIYPDKQQLAKAAAHETITLLQDAVAARGTASWVLAGGTAPEIAYRIIAEQYIEAVDWSRVTLLIGDERIGTLDSPDNSWHQIEQAFLRLVPDALLLRPQSELSAEEAADNYAEQLESLPKTDAELPRLDVVWLGMGEDGHTLSLFPGHPDFQPTDRLVIPVHNSPKPPADRISLTLRALEGAGATLILTSGAGKAEAVKSAQQAESNLPIAQAARVTSASWLIDQDAAKLIGN